MMASILRIEYDETRGNFKVDEARTLRGIILVRNWFSGLDAFGEKLRDPKEALRAGTISLEGTDQEARGHNTEHGCGAESGQLEKMNVSSEKTHFARRYRAFFFMPNEELLLFVFPKSSTRTMLFSVLPTAISLTSTRRDERSQKYISTFGTPGGWVWFFEQTHICALQLKSHSPDLGRDHSSAQAWFSHTQAE